MYISRSSACLSITLTMVLIGLVSASSLRKYLPFQGKKRTPKTQKTTGISNMSSMSDAVPEDEIIHLPPPQSMASIITETCLNLHFRKSDQTEAISFGFFASPPTYTLKIKCLTEADYHALYTYEHLPGLTCQAVEMVDQIELKWKCPNHDDT